MAGSPYVVVEMRYSSPARVIQRGPRGGSLNLLPRAGRGSYLLEYLMCDGHPRGGSRPDGATGEPCHSRLLEHCTLAVRRYSCGCQHATIAHLDRGSGRLVVESLVDPTVALESPQWASHALLDAATDHADYIRACSSW